MSLTTAGQEWKFQTRQPYKKLATIHNEVQALLLDCYKEQYEKPYGEEIVWQKVSAL